MLFLCVSTTEIYIVPVCFYNKNIRYPVCIYNRNIRCLYLFLQQKTLPCAYLNKNIRCPCVFLQQKYTLSLCVSTTEIYVVTVCFYNKNIRYPVCIYNRNIRCPYLFLQQKALPCVCLQQKYTLSLCVSTTEMYVAPVCFYNKNIRCPCVYLQQKCSCPFVYLQ